MQLSVLGFGWRAVGGLMVRGECCRSGADRRAGAQWLYGLYGLDRALLGDELKRN
jgi:hypothetical protein